MRPEHLVCEGLALKPPEVARRTRGSGSVEVRGSKVRIRASVKDPVTGRRLQPSFTVPAAQAKQETERVKSELALGRYRGTSATFGDLLDKALLVHVPTLAPTAQDTFKNYAKYLRPLRGYPLRKLEEHPEIVEEFYAAGIPALRGNGKFLNPMSIRHVTGSWPRPSTPGSDGDGSATTPARRSSCHLSRRESRSHLRSTLSGP